MKDMNNNYSSVEIIERVKIIDERGWFLKIITGFENNIDEKLGEIYCVYSENGFSRGGHYHLIAKEWFTLIQGKCLLEIFNIDTNEKNLLYLNHNTPQTIYVPPRFAHRFKSIGNEPFLIVAYTNTIYNRSDTININF
jgi:dTDP-4-dehydrorhamnose 3,5-epimerase-like enzyme